MVKKEKGLIGFYTLTSQPIGLKGGLVILEGSKYFMVEKTLCFDFQITINKAKYEALIDGLKLAKDIGI